MIVQWISVEFQDESYSHSLALESGLAMSSSFELAGVLWDMDGTLLDTETLSDEAMLLAITDVYNFSPPAHPPSQVDFTWEIKKSIIGTRSAEWVSFPAYCLTSTFR